MDLRSEIQKIALECPAYGRRRITQEWQDRGWKVNGKRVRRVMREDNLLCLRRRKYVVTTDSNHDQPVYPNLAADMTLSGLNQLWVADITAFGWKRSSSIWRSCWTPARRVNRVGAGPDNGNRTAADGATDAAGRAGTGPGLVHHSDRGNVYALGLYTGLLKEHGVPISMSRRGNAYDECQL